MGGPPFLQPSTIQRAGLRVGGRTRELQQSSLRIVTVGQQVSQRLDARVPPAAAVPTPIGSIIELSAEPAFLCRLPFTVMTAIAATAPSARRSPGSARDTP